MRSSYSRRINKPEGGTVGRTLRGAACATVAAIALGSCGGGKGGSSAPTTPTSTTPTVTAVTVTAPASTAKPGDSAQFTATAVMSNSSTQTVTTQSTWQSSNPTLATVSAFSGVVTALAPGEMDIRATYQTVSGSAHVMRSIKRGNIHGTCRRERCSRKRLSGSREQELADDS